MHTLGDLSRAPRTAGEIQQQQLLSKNEPPSNADVQCSADSWLHELHAHCWLKPWHTDIYRVAANPLLPRTAHESEMTQDWCMTHWRGGSASMAWGGAPASTPSLTPANSPAWLTRWPPRSHAPAAWRSSSKRRWTHARRPTAGTKTLRTWHSQQ